MVYRIHPGIGVARVGDSPTDWFIGPETVAEPDPPYGGYRDAEGRIKRQAGRFRVFDHVGGTATPVAGTAVTWTVLLGPDPAGPSVRVTGPNQLEALPAVAFASGPPALVSWGEARTDAEGQLLVLSGVVEGSFSATSCGRITAEIGGTTVSAWILLLPPNFTPYRRPSLSVYDYLIELGGAGAPSPLRFLRDIHPLLQGVGIGNENLPAGTAAEHTAALRFSTFGVTSSGLACGDHVTPTARAILTSWTTGAFDATDWTSPPPPPSLDDPRELDRGPLSRVAFGGWDLTAGPASFLNTLTFLATDPLRLDLAADPYPSVFRGFGNWRRDNCSAEWPQIWGVPGGSLPYTPDQTWRQRGFVVRQAGERTYVESVAGSITSSLLIRRFVLLLTRRLEFGAVRAGTPGQTAAIVLEVGHQTAGVDFTLTLPAWLSGPASYNVPPQATGVVATVHIPISYVPGATPVDRTGEIQLQQVGGPLYVIPVHAETVRGVDTAIAFALDYSNSMHQRLADGSEKIDKLRGALDTFQTLVSATDAVGAAAFNHGLLGTQAITTTPGAVPTFAAGLSPSGQTSIGRGIQEASALLAAGGGPYGQRALVVVTDGLENRAPWINDASRAVVDPTRVFCIGIGRPQDVNTAKLQALSGNQGGYLLLTGDLGGSPEDLLLEKYLLRILTNATNLEMLLDPPLLLQPGKVERIPFSVCEFDESFEAVVLSRDGDRVAFALEAPGGAFVTPVDLEAISGCAHLTGRNLACYRVGLPLPMRSAPAAAAGTWHLLLAVTRPKGEALSSELDHVMLRSQTRLQSQLPPLKHARCETLVHARSELRMAATVAQTGLSPGASMLFEVQLTLRGVPFDGPVRAEGRIEDPTGFPFTVSLAPEGIGRYVGRFQPVKAGLYRVTLVCEGTTPGLHAFRREQLATAAVLDERGSPPAPAEDPRALLDALCSCVNTKRELARKLQEALCTHSASDARAALRRLASWCRGRAP